MKLETITPTQTMPFEQAREQISERVFTDKRKDEFQKYLEKLRAQAIIEWKNEDVKKAYEEGIKQELAGRAAAPSASDGPSDRRATWFAIWTRSRHEQVVREQLERKHIDAFLPTITRWSRWKDRKKKIDWPLFPGYCFARFDPRRRAADPEVHRRREHRLVRRQAGADPRAASSTASACWSAASCNTIRVR